MATGSFPARWRGNCPHCGGMFFQAELVAYHRNQGPMHEQCAQELAAEERSERKARREETP